MKPENQSSQKHQHNEEQLSYAKIVTKNLQPQNNFLGHQTANHHFIGQAVQVQQPFLDQKTHIQTSTLDSQRNQNQIMDLLVSLNQRMFNLEKGKMQM